MAHSAYDVKLCEECQQKADKAMEAWNFTGVTTEELVEMEAHMPFSLAIELALEGQVVRRVDEKYGFTVHKTFYGDKEKVQFAILNDNSKIIAYKGNFTTEEILAEDYIIVK